MNVFSALSNFRTITKISEKMIGTEIPNGLKRINEKRELIDAVEKYALDKMKTFSKIN
jgi:hypothetical protein